MLISPGLQPHLTAMVQLCQTSSSTISGVSALNYAVVSKYGKMLTQNINTSIWF